MTTGVIAAVVGIFVFVLKEVWPLFEDASIGEVTELWVGDLRNPLVAGIDPYQEIVYVVHSEGVAFYRISDGGKIQDVRPEGLGDARITSARRSVSGDSSGWAHRMVVFLAFASGSMWPTQQTPGP